MERIADYGFYKKKITVSYPYTKKFKSLNFEGRNIGNGYFTQA